MTAASLVPSMVIVTTCGVPSMVVTVNVSVSVSQTLSACTALVGVVERVNPHAGRRHGEGAVAAGARLWRTDRREGVGRIVDVGVGERAGRRRFAVLGIGDATGLGHQPVLVPEMTAASLLPLMVIVTTCCGAVHGGHRESVGQRVVDIERLYRVVVVVERVDPHAVRRHREGAIATFTCRRGFHGRESIGWIVDVGSGKRAGRGRRVALGVRRSRSPNRSCRRK